MLFCLLHIDQMLQSGLTAISIMGMALAFLWLRLHSAAVGPAVVAHMGYNGAVAAVFVYYGGMA